MPLRIVTYKRIGGNYPTVSDLTITKVTYLEVRSSTNISTVQVNFLIQKLSFLPVISLVVTFLNDIVSSRGNAIA